MVDLLVTIRNSSERNYQDLTFTDYLETGFEYSPTSPPAPLAGEEGSGLVSFDAQDGKISHIIQSLAPGEEVNFSYVEKTPVVDGGGLKNTLENRAPAFVDGKIGDYINARGRRVMVTVGVDRWGRSRSFVQAGYETVIRMPASRSVPLALGTAATS